MNFVGKADKKKVNGLGELMTKINSTYGYLNFSPNFD
jgi:hypothetical protein